MADFISRLAKFMQEKGINDNQITIAAGLSNGLIGKAKVSGKGMTAANIEKNTMRISPAFTRMATNGQRGNA